MMQTNQAPNSHEDAIFIAQMAILRRNFPFALLGSLLTVGLIVIALWNVLAQRELMVWLVLNFAVMVLRISVMRTYKTAQNEVLALRRWGQKMLWCTALAGIVWGLPYGYWLFQAPFEYQMFMIIGLLTLGTGAIYAYCIYMPLLLAFEIPYFLPSFIALAMNLDTLHQVLAAAGMLYLFVTLAFAQRACTARNVILCKCVLKIETCSSDWRLRKKPPIAVIRQNRNFSLLPAMICASLCMP